MFLSINFLEGRFEGRKGREEQEKHGAIPYEKWMSQGVVKIVAINGNIIRSIYTWRKKGDCSVIAAENIIMLLKNSLQHMVVDVLNWCGISRLSWNEFNEGLKNGWPWNLVTLENQFTYMHLEDVLMRTRITRRIASTFPAIREI